MLTHSRIRAWEIPWTEGPGGLQSMGSQWVRHDWACSLSSTFIETCWAHEWYSACLLVLRILEKSPQPTWWPCYRQVWPAHIRWQSLGSKDTLLGSEFSSDTFYLGSQVALVVKNLPARAGDVSSILGQGSPGGEHGTPLQYFCLENPMDRGAWGVDYGP